MMSTFAGEKFSDSLLIVAAEESSCKYALKVMKEILLQKPDVSFWGVGNYEMQGLGFKRVAKAEELAVMGLFEILRNQKIIRKAFTDILNQAEILKPKVALLLDYGGFNLRLAARLKKMGIRVVYYIPPKVWVWKTSRVYKIKKFVDDVLVVHPFEVDFFKKFGVPSVYVGHPLLEDYYDYKNINFSKDAFKSKIGLDSSINLGFMPGSRESEVVLLLTPMLEIAEQILKLKPNLNISFLVAPGFDIENFKNRLNKKYDFPIHFIKEDSWKMIDVCDYMVTASGTATLQVGLLKKPQIVVYKMNPLSAVLAKIVVRGIKYFGLVNLILGRKICPEYFQSEVNSLLLAKKMLSIIGDEDNQKENMLKEYNLLENELKGPGAAKLVSQCVLKHL